MHHHQQHTTELEVKIGDIKGLLEKGYKVEVDSPDGWVNVSDFVDKGQWDEYAFCCNGKSISCNENHLFQSTMGWMSAKDIFNAQEHTSSKLHFLTDSGRYEPGTIMKTGKKVPIVDIQVDHDNHRYYTDGISSHNTGVGKSLGMCHLAAADLSMGRNVLYITMEMAEERIAERIDANLLDVRIDELKNLSESAFASKIKNLSERTKGKIVIKEYPTASAHAGHFRALLHELKLKKKFIPDVIYIDYLNICASSRIKGLSGSVNTYSLIKAIAEELRGLAVEFNVPIWSATQVTRAGYCLDPLTIIETEYGNKHLNEIIVGDRVKSNTGFNDVITVFPKTKKKAYRITTSSGKTIVCSDDHKFPVNGVDKSIKSGLKIGDSLVTLN
jgi:hypothetical protein